LLVHMDAPALDINLSVTRDVDIMENDLLSHRRVMNADQPSSVPRGSRCEGLTICDEPSRRASLGCQ
jgi:hypothetical protein